MPQIEQIAATYASQVFWLLITFGLLYLVIGKSMVPRVEGTVDARDRRIADDLAAARAARETAERTEREWEAEMERARAAAQAETAAAKARATAAFETQVRHADADLAQRLAHHDTAVASAKAQAMANLQTVAAEAAQEMVAKLSGLRPGIEAATDAVRRVGVHG